jgi:hypothetical protein
VRDWQAQQRAEGRAVAALIRAAEALLVPTAPGKATALLYAAQAMVHIAESDPHAAALDLAIREIRELAKEPGT